MLSKPWTKPAQEPSTKMPLPKSSPRKPTDSTPPRCNKCSESHPSTALVTSTTKALPTPSLTVKPMKPNKLLIRTTTTPILFIFPIAFNCFMFYSLFFYFNRQKNLYLDLFICSKFGIDQNKYTTRYPYFKYGDHISDFVVVVVNFCLRVATLRNKKKWRINSHRLLVSNNTE